MIGRRLALFLGAATLLPMAPRTASACYNTVEIVIDPRVQQLTQAEKLLSAGNPSAAARATVRVFPRLMSMKAREKDPLLGRAMRIMAVATVRVGGAFASAGDFRQLQEEQRKTNLMWAVDTLTKLHARRPTDAGLATERGEALAALESHEKEALAILGPLADRDIIASPHGYAALARVREAGGDHEGAELALEKCRTMTKQPSVCDVLPVKDAI
jgi:hypothetical protein